MLHHVVENRDIDETFDHVAAVAIEIGASCFPDNLLANTRQLGKLDDHLPPEIFYARAIAVGILGPFIFDGEGAVQSGAQRLESYLENKGMFPDIGGGIDSHVFLALRP